MKNALWRLLDLLIPDDIKEFEQREELARARALVFVLAVNLLLSALTTAALLASPRLLPYLSQLAIPVTTGCTFGYAAALLVFRRWGMYTAAGNICALVGYCVILYVALTVPPVDAISVLLVLLTLPPLIALMASLVSALVWLGVIAATPLVIMLNRDLPGVSTNYLAGWELTCTGLLLSTYVGSNYRKGIVQRLNAERARFEFAAAHDPLTGLANRATFDRRLRECLKFCTVHDTRAILILVDLDKFKPINDTYGHQAGDIVLRTVADRLCQQMRKSDTVARVGGDEFAILIDQDCPSDLDSLLRRMRQCIEAPIAVSGNSVRVGCSYGVVMYPDDGMHPHQLAQKADERMYEVKRQGKTPSAEILNFPNTAR